MNIFRRFVSALVCKVPGISDLSKAILSLVESVNECCSALLELRAAHLAHEQAILQLYAQQGIMMRMVSTSSAGADIVALKSSGQKVSKPNLHVRVLHMPAKIVDFLKKYWSHVLLLVVLVVSTLALRAQKNDFVNDMQKVQSAHVVEIQKIQDARVEERRLLEANVKKLEQTLSIVQQQYDSAKKDLDVKKKREVEEIIAQYKDDPTTLAKKLSESTGFQIILPE